MKREVNHQPQEGIQEAPAPQPVRVQTTPSLHTPLPTFDGKPENWFKFKAIFMDVMNKHVGESDATKLYHLDKCLVGEASGTIDPQTINDGNFAAAMEHLTVRYEDKRKIVDIHINGVLNLKAMTCESGKQLRELVHECKRHVDALNFFEFEMDGLSDIMVVSILASKHDLETRKLWEGSIDHGEIPKYAEMMKFLTTRSQVLERIEPTSKPRKSNVTSAAKIPPLKTSSLAASVDCRCNFCEQAHLNIEI